MQNFKDFIASWIKKIDKWGPKKEIEGLKVEFRKIGGPFSKVPIEPVDLKKVDLTERVYGPTISSVHVFNPESVNFYIGDDDVIIGGRQNRLIKEDTIIPAKRFVPLNVLCVEPGRWHPFVYGNRFVRTFSLPPVFRSLKTSSRVIDFYPLQVATWELLGLFRRGIVNRSLKKGFLELIDTLRVYLSGFSGPGIAMIAADWWYVEIIPASKIFLKKLARILLAWFLEIVFLSSSQDIYEAPASLEKGLEGLVFEPSRSADRKQKTYIGLSPFYVVSITMWAEAPVRISIFPRFTARALKRLAGASPEVLKMASKFDELKGEVEMSEKFSSEVSAGPILSTGFSGEGLKQKDYSIEFLMDIDRMRRQFKIKGRRDV